MKTRLILKPGQKGTKRLTKKYGKLLICIRFRYDAEHQRRLKTVELIEEESDWVPPPSKFAANSLVPVRIAASNLALREMIKAAGGKWVPDEKLWYVRYGAIAGGKLEKHIHVYEKESKAQG